MEIQYLGDYSFRIKTKKAILVTDPQKKTFADIVAISDRENSKINPALVRGTKRRPQPFVLPGPGEYEISGVSILGRRWGKTIIHIIETDELRLVHLGSLRRKLSEEELEEVNGVDVVFVPAEAGEVVFQIEPKIAIPMGEKSPADFLKTLGAEETKPLSSLIITSKNLPEERQVVVLNARS
ncbi:MAG: MBL fold metallo-hydrolase [Microgenomates group bacterium]